MTPRGMKSCLGVKSSVVTERNRRSFMGVILVVGGWYCRYGKTVKFVVVE